MTSDCEPLRDADVRSPIERNFPSIRFLCQAVLAISLFAATALPAAELTIAAAANMKFAFDELASAFQVDHPAISIRMTYGSSGNFYSQIRNAAPFDLFFSADMDYPRRLAEAGLALETNVFQYAVGRIVIWVPKSSPLDVEKLGMRTLTDSSVRKIAIANPRHAPYGAAAVSAMKAAGVYEHVEGKLVYGENVSQAAQFVQSGAADAGVIAMSLVLAPPMRNAGRHWEIPPDTYSKIEQGAVILRPTRDAAAARAFCTFLRSRGARDVMLRYGYSTPD